jgi:hypothetical protein
VAGSSVTVKYRLPRYALNEAEAGMAREFGLGDPTPSAGAGIVTLIMSLFPVTAVIDDIGIRVTGGALRPWAEFGMAYETEHLVCLVVTSTTGPLTVPKASLDDTRLAALRDLISRHVVSTPETLDAIRRVRPRAAIALTGLGLGPPAGGARALRVQPAPLGEDVDGNPIPDSRSASVRGRVAPPAGVRPTPRGPITWRLWQRRRPSVYRTSRGGV